MQKKKEKKMKEKITKIKKKEHAEYEMKEK